MSSKNGIIVNCSGCKQALYKSQWYLKRNKTHWCSPGCRNFQTLNKCKGCGLEMYMERYRLVKSGPYYCSIKCRGLYKKEWFQQNPEAYAKIIKSLTGRKQSPETIQKRVLKNKGRKRTTEQLQRIRKMIPRGENNHSWKGGISPFTYRLRRGLEMRLWRESVFTRDNWSCKSCGVRGGKLHAHHIKQFSVIVSENNIKSFEQGLNCKELWSTDNGVTLCVPCHKAIPIVR